MADTPNLRVYPRGFLGAVLGAPVPQPVHPFHALVQTHQFHPEMFKQRKGVPETNQNIEKIYSHFLSHRDAMMDFDFREKVILSAFSAFGTDDFMKWVMTQYKGPAISDLHAEFIEDTLNFIMTGKRRLAVMSWLPLLTLSNVNTNVTVPSEFVKAFFVVPENKLARNVKMSDVIQRWCHHEGGFEDMLQTLHVLFGDIVA